MKRVESTTRAILAAAALAALLSLLAACTPAGGAIFATIEQEDKTVQSNLPDTAVVANVLELRAGGTSFVAAGRTLFLGVQRIAGDNANLDWKAISIRLEATPGSGYTASPDTTCRSAVLVSGATAETDRVFAVLAAPPADGETTALYSATPVETIATDDPPTLQWSAATPLGLSGQLEGVLLVGGELFVTTRTSTEVVQFALYHYDLSADTATLVIPYTPVPVIDGAFHDSAYWFIAGNAVYTGALPGPFAAAADALIASSASYGGVHASGTTLHLSTRDGKLFVHPAGGAWSGTPAALTLSGDTTALAFTDFVSVGTFVFVGTEGRGFFRLADGLLPADAPTLALARMPDRTLNELYAGAILGFVHLEDVHVLFIRTAGAGLWHQVVDADLPLKGWIWD